MPNYFYGLKKNDLREFLDEEVYFRAYGFHLLEDKTRDRVIRIYEGKSKGSQLSRMEDESKSNADKDASLI